MHPLVQALVWALKAYGSLCLILFVVAVLKLIRTEMAGSERSSYRGRRALSARLCSDGGGLVAFGEITSLKSRHAKVAAATLRAEASRHG